MLLKHTSPPILSPLKFTCYLLSPLLVPIIYLCFSDLKHSIQKTWLNLPCASRSLSRGLFLFSFFFTWWAGSTGCAVTVIQPYAVNHWILFWRALKRAHQLLERAKKMYFDSALGKIREGSLCLLKRSYTHPVILLFLRCFIFSQTTTTTAYTGWRTW